MKPAYSRFTDPQIHPRSQRSHSSCSMTLACAIWIFLDVWFTAHCFVLHQGGCNGEAQPSPMSFARSHCPQADQLRSVKVVLSSDRPIPKCTVCRLARCRRFTNAILSFPALCYVNALTGLTAKGTSQTCTACK